MGKRSRTKGASAEREVVKILKEAGFETERNLTQTRDGGRDLLGIDGFAIEVKRQERLNIQSWWEQAVSQAGDDSPVLLFRRNREKWRVVIELDHFVNYLKLRREKDDD